MAAAGWLKQVIDRDRPKRVFVDVGGVGAGIYDRLGEMGYGAIVRAVNFGSAPLEPPPRDEHGEPSGGPLNRRAEMWMKSREWLEDPAGAADPRPRRLQADACGPTYTYDSNTRLKLEAKDHMRARGLKSPDEWDAVALTFAEPVAPGRGSGGSWSIRWSVWREARESTRTAKSADVAVRSVRAPRRRTVRPGRRRRAVVISCPSPFSRPRSRSSGSPRFGSGRRHSTACSCSGSAARSR